jgi:YggT family protein
MGNAGAGFNFLISTIFDLYAFVVMLRFLMQLTRADYYNPVSQFVVKATDPLLKPLRRFIPGFGGYDIAAIVLCFLVLLVKFILLQAIGGAAVAGIGGSVVAAIIGAHREVGLIGVLLDVFFFSILAMVILSWVSPGGNPISGLLRSITSPILGPIQKVVPPMGGFDLSPLVALLAIQFIRIVFRV